MRLSSVARLIVASLFIGMAPLQASATAAVIEPTGVQEVHPQAKAAAERVTKGLHGAGSTATIRARAERAAASDLTRARSATDQAAATAAVWPPTDRVFGPGRYDTSAAVSNTYFEAPATEADRWIVFIGVGTNFPDALAGGSAAAQWDAPLLLVPSSGTVPQVILNEITRLNPLELVILGSDRVIPPAVVDQLVGATPARDAVPNRYYGVSRYGTAADIAYLSWSFEWDDQGNVISATPPPIAYLATGETFADALAGGPAAAMEGAPLLLTQKNVLPTETAVALSEMQNTHVRVLGSSAGAVSDAVLASVGEVLPTALITRHYGTSRFDTAAAINKTVFSPTGAEAHLVFAMNFPDALSVAPTVFRSGGGPTILSLTDCIDSASIATVNETSPSLLTAIGSTLVLSDAALGGLPCATPPPPPPPPTGIQAQAALQLDNGFAVPTVSASRSMLDSLRVASPGSMVGYDRALFPHWRDADTWGWPPVPNANCDVRQASLYREGTSVSYDSACTILGGSWLDPYTAVWLYAASDVDIDHIVPLAEAWRTGAASWTTEQRTRFANDQLEVMAVDDGANASKGDKAPDLWKPPNTAGYCLYAKRWTAIKQKYALSVSTTEKTALQAMLNTCTS